jgi:hypothetical protein
MSPSFRFFLSFSLGVLLILSLSACGGSPEEPISGCENPSTFNGPQRQECYPR